MHYFKDAPSDNEIIINNLRLLNYDVKEANTTFRLNIDSLTIENMKAHPKLIISIIHFIVFKLAEDESFLTQFTAMYNFYQEIRYPPRSQVEQSLYKQEIAKYLKNTNKIPKNFIITKVMLDQRVFSFIRYVSEFALRAQFLNTFPTKKLLTFYLDPMRLFYEDRPCVNEINDMFQISNYQFENLNNLSVPLQIIKLLTGLCGHQILIQIKKLRKQLKKNCSFIDSIQITIDTVSENLKSERDRSLKLIQQLQQFKNQINPQYLSKERKLDRKPQLDSSYRVFNGISNIIRQYRELQMDHNMNQIQSTIRLDKFCDENNLNQLQQKHNSNVTHLITGVQKIEKETWVKDRGLKCRQISLETLNKIKQLKLQVESHD